MRSSRLFKAHERRVDRALVEQHFIAADLLDAARNAVAVKLPHGGECLKHHEVQGSLQEVEF
jgi:hypothetical protein